jgi:hypothetical protein
VPSSRALQSKVQTMNAFKRCDVTIYNQSQGRMRADAFVFKFQNAFSHCLLVAGNEGFGVRCLASFIISRSTTKW